MDRLISSMFTGGKLILCYLMAAALQLTFMRWPDLGGDPHVPLSAFPWSLIWSPIVPFYTVLDVLTQGADANHMKAILVFGVAFIAASGLLFWMPPFLRKNA